MCSHEATALFSQHEHASCMHIPLSGACPQSYKKLAAAADNLATSVQHSRAGSNREAGDSGVTTPFSDSRKKIVTIKGSRSVASGSTAALLAPPATPMLVKAEGIQAWAAAAAVAAAAAATSAGLLTAHRGDNAPHVHRQQLYSPSSVSSELMPFGVQDGSRPLTSRPMSASSG